MKILQVIPQLSQGGAERFVIDLCNEIGKNHTIILIVLHSIDEYGFFSNELNPNIQLISMNKKKGIDFSLFFRLFNLIRKEKPDVVHTHLRSIVYILLSFIFNRKVKYIHTVHNDAEKEAGKGFNKWCRKFAFKRKLVYPITISEESQLSFNKFYQVTSTLIYNGRPEYIELSNLKTIEEEINTIKTNKSCITIINVARIQKQKNQYILSKAVQSLNKKGYSIELFIIGDKADLGITENIKNLNSPFIHMLGTRNNPRDYMKIADAFCLSSLYEGMPITLIECFSVGCIPICTPVGGIINMITDNKNGLLSNGTTQEDMESILLKFMSLTPQEKSLMQIESKKSYSAFTMKNCAAQYIQVINKL